MDKKMKTNQDGGGESSTAPANELKENQKGAAKYNHGAADGHMKDEKKGAAKYKGAHDYDTSKGSHDHPHGAAKMGYSQSFGAARMNGYAKGAAKVASVMSFGASKYMKHGAADAGHGGPEGHDHPSMTITSRNTSGGGSSSSSSNSTGGGSSSSSNGSSSSGKSYSSAYKNADKSKYPTLESFTVAAKAYNAKNNKNSSANVTSSSSSSENTNAGSSTTTSNTTTSPNSMAETILQANIGNENRAQRFNFDRDEANITATNDSINAANKALDKLPRHRQSTPQGQRYASRAGSRAAAYSRINSGLFSRKEAAQIYRDGQNQQ